MGKARRRGAALPEFSSGSWPPRQQLSNTPKITVLNRNLLIFFMPKIFSIMRVWIIFFSLIIFHLQHHGVVYKNNNVISISHPKPKWKLDVVRKKKNKKYNLINNWSWCPFDSWNLKIDTFSLWIQKPFKNGLSNYFDY